MNFPGGEKSDEQETADVSKIVDMDQKPAFLETGDLERLSNNPEVRTDTERVKSRLGFLVRGRRRPNRG